ncbi:MAG: hypothetical protein KC505_00665 [Myxococcales bacterium]|nr:hypothetical protein [Myxococcales bacterium]USN51461.1 MAG: hypothetical protein H6731_03370 [Myxococcales bacterium]
MLSQKLFFILVSLVACQRIFELYWSHRNEKILLAQGAFRHAHDHFLFMKMIHATWLIAIFIEVYFLRRTFYPLWGYFSLSLFFIGQILRITAIVTLGHRWTASIVIVPKEKLISHGIYRFVRHPNYWGVILEIAFLPLVYSAIYTSVIFSVLNLIILFVRIRHEERGLRRYCL